LAGAHWTIGHEKRDQKRFGVAKKRQASRLFWAPPPVLSITLTRFYTRKEAAG
jgi:hypothetical protein